MPSLTTHQSQSSTKLLLIGDSGSGKTGALASLAEAGYRLIILDFDNGLDILVNILKQRGNEKALERIFFATLRDKVKAVGGQMVLDGVPKAFATAMQLLTNWKTSTEDLGNAGTWGPETILVIDSLTFMSNYAFNYVGAINAFKDPRQTFYEAQKQIEAVLGMLSSEALKCNVIVNAHITLVELENGLTKAYPSSIGKAFSPKIPRYFNSVLEAKTRGAGANAKHVIITVPDGMLELKTSAAPGIIPNELPIETGLAQVFKLLQGPGAGANAQPKEVA